MTNSAIIDSLNNEIKNIKEEVSELKAYEEKYLSISSSIDINEKIIKEKEIEAESLKNTITQLTSKVNELAESIEELNNQISKKDSLISEFESRIIQTQETMDNQDTSGYLKELEVKLSELSNNNSQLKESLESQKTDFNKMKSKLEENTDYIKQLEDIKRKKTILNQEQGREIAELKKSNSELKDSDNQKNELIKVLRERISELEYEIQNGNEFSKNSDKLIREVADIDTTEIPEPKVESSDTAETDHHSNNEKRKLNLLHFPTGSDENGSFKKVKYGDLAIIKINLIRATLDSVSEFKNYMNKIILEGERKLIIDLSMSDFIDSTFLGVMVHSLKKLNPGGGDVRLVITSDTSLGILHVTRMDRIFKIFRDLESAIESYNERNSTLASG